MSGPWVPMSDDARPDSLLGLTIRQIRDTISDTIQLICDIDKILIEGGNEPLAVIFSGELANYSSLLGQIFNSALVKRSNGLFKANGPNKHPDLIFADGRSGGLEVKKALETNTPKGHLPKPGNYLTLRYVLGFYDTRKKWQKSIRGDRPIIWEVKAGFLSESDYNVSSTAGDSGKTAVPKAEAFQRLDLLYFDPEHCPHQLERYLKSHNS